MSKLSPASPAEPGSAFLPAWRPKTRALVAGLVGSALLFGLLAVEVFIAPGFLAKWCGLAVARAEEGTMPADLESPSGENAADFMARQFDAPLDLSEQDIVQLAIYAAQIDAALKAMATNCPPYYRYRQIYYDLMPQLFSRVREGEFPVESGRKWAEVVAIEAPNGQYTQASRMDYLMAAVIRRRVTRRHISDLLDQANWWKSNLATLIAYDKKLAEVDEVLPMSFRPSRTTSGMHFGGHLDPAIEFLQKTLRNGGSRSPSTDASRSGSGTGSSSEETAATLREIEEMFTEEKRPEDVSKEDWEKTKRELLQSYRKPAP